MSADAASLIAELAKAGRAVPRASTLSPQERIDQLLKSVASAGKNQRKLSAALKREVDLLRADFTSSTMHSYLVRYRKAISDRFGSDHPGILMLFSEPAARKLGVEGVGFTADEVKARKSADRRRVTSHQRSMRAILEPSALIKHAVGMIRHPGVFERGGNAGKPRWDRLCAGLLLLTGRRPIEILATGDFEPIRGDTRAVMFTGQAKTRNAPGTQQEAYRIPLLAPASIILRAFLVLRSYAPEKSLSQRLSETARDEFEFTARDLRAVYARLSYHAFAPEGMADTSWFADVLGHKLVVQDAETKRSARTAVVADTLTAAYYQKFYIPGARHRLKLPI